MGEEEITNYFYYGGHIMMALHVQKFLWAFIYLSPEKWWGLSFVQILSSINQQQLCVLINFER